MLCLLGVLSDACGTTASPPPMVAQVSGTLTLEGVASPIRIVRDRWGVPHIYAGSRDDLFFAQGFVQAQDRLFQMDLWRRSVQGRLSQVLGPNFIERDAMTRRVQYRGDLDAEWASYGPETKAIAAAFVRGVNAWVALARERPPEEFILAGWKPDFWDPVDLLNRTDLFVASRTPIDESTPEGALVADVMRRVGAPPFFVGLAADVRQRAGAEAARPDTTDQSAAGRIATRLDHPSRRYLVHLNAPGWNAIGATAPWLPGVGIGHDDRAAWDATSVHIDAPAIEVVKVNPGNAHQIEEGGRWVDTDVVKDAVIVKGRKEEPFVYETDYTSRGVIVATDRERHLAFAMRWRGVEAGAIPALLALTADRSSLPPWTRLAKDTAVALQESPRVLFAHPLGITAEARRRFNVGPFARPANGGRAFAVDVNASDWDGSTAINAPGQSESPDSAHFGDLAAQWSAGKTIPLVFSDRAVQAAAEATLTLAPRRP